MEPASSSPPSAAEAADPTTPASPTAPVGPAIPAALTTPAGPRWPALLEAYLAEVAKRTDSRRTPAEYRRYLARFFALVGDPARATPAHAHAFAYGPGASDREPSSSTVMVRLAAVRGFYAFARRMRVAVDNPADGVQRPKHREPTPRGLAVAELRRLLAAPRATPTGRRDRAIILTCVLTGLRRSEALGLRAGDLQRRDGRVYYRVRLKGGTERHRELPAPAFAAICAALAAEGRGIDALPPDARLFAVSAHGFYLNLRRYAKWAGLGNVAPHVLRHSAAKLRRTTGSSLEDVSAFLGHRSLATTHVYLQRLEGETDTGWTAVAAALGIS
jgi:site-specific recombinase XerD